MSTNVYKQLQVGQVQVERGWGGAGAGSVSEGDTLRGAQLTAARTAEVQVGHMYKNYHTPTWIEPM